MASSDSLPDVELQLLHRQLLAETFVRQAELFAELDSTNTYALRQGAGEVETPLLVWTLQQTAGRGRGTNRWWSAEGSLTFTLLIEPLKLEVPQPQWPTLSLNVGLAVCSLLQRLQVPDVRLKWPNDVYVGSRKICGILIESVPTQPQRLAIGIGLNVNNSFQEAPLEVRDRATSLLDELDVSTPLPHLLLPLLRELHDVLHLSARSPELFPPLWNQLSWLTGRQVIVEDVRGQLGGHVSGIDADGALRLQTARGSERVVSGTITVSS